MLEAFHVAGDRSRDEFTSRKDFRKKLLKFGISYLDDATEGIFPSDLILLGAPSGFGKTQLCCLIANANMEDGKRVHYIALEADRHEIEQRIKYQIFVDMYLKDESEDKPKLAEKVSFRKWRLGDYQEILRKYEDFTTEYFEKSYRSLFIYYKTGEYYLANLIEQVTLNAQETDLIIVDHVHYFDLDDDNENKAMKEIAKTARNLALEENVPIILVSHLRKRDKSQDSQLVADMEEFHGSSDLFKIATKVITLASGEVTEDGNYETFFRIPKCRLDGGLTKYIGRLLFNPRKGNYEEKYKIGWASQTRRDGFSELEIYFRPNWATRYSEGSEGQSLCSPLQNSGGYARAVKNEGRKNHAEGIKRKTHWNDL